MMNLSITGLLLLSLIFFVKSAGASDCSQTKDSLRSLTGVAADILKQTQIDYVRKDPHDFCQRNMLLRGLNANHATPEDVAKISTDELKERYAAAIQSGSSWEESLIPTKNNRVRPFISAAGGSFDDSKEKLGQMYNKKVMELAEYFSQPEKAVLKTDCSKMKNALPSNRGCYRMNSIELPQISAKEKIASCAEVNVWHTLSCESGLNKIADIMTPIATEVSVGTRYAPVKAWKEVLENSKYDAGLRLAALKITERLQVDHQDKNANIFSDLRDSFRQSGMSLADAKDATFNVLGLIAGASSNLGGRLHGDLGLDNQKARALEVIALALPLLDYKKATEEKGTLYSLPGSISSTCDNAKTYHFWLAAYAARTLVKDNGIDSTGAQMSTFVSEKGYQVARSLGFASVMNASSVITKLPYDPVQQVQRMDLNFAAAGAAFGAQSAISSKDLKLNLDQSLSSMIENSNVTRPPSKEEAQRMGLISSYLKWEKEVSPNSAFDAIQKQVDDSDAN